MVIATIIVTNFFCQELLNEVGGKVVVVPSYVIPKRGAKPYKKLVSFNYVGDFHFVENWLKLELSDQLIVAFEYIPFNVVFDLPIGFASASVLLPDQTRMEFIVKCQYSRAVSERDPSKRDGVLVLEFSFPTGYFEEEPLSEFEKVIKPIELDDSVSPLV